MEVEGKGPAQVWRGARRRIDPAVEDKGMNTYGTVRII